MYSRFSIFMNIANSISPPPSHMAGNEMGLGVVFENDNFRLDEKTIFFLDV